MCGFQERFLVLADADQRCRGAGTRSYITLVLDRTPQHSMTNPATKRENLYNREKARRRAAEATAAAYVATVEDLSKLDNEQEDENTRDSFPPPLEETPWCERRLPAHPSTHSSSSSSSTSSPGPSPHPRIPRVDNVDTDDDDDGITSLPSPKLPIWPPATVRDMGDFLYFELGPKNGGNNSFLTTPNGLKDKISKGIVGGPLYSYKVLPYHPYFFEMYGSKNTTFLTTITTATRSTISEKKRELAGSHPLKVMERILQTRGLFSSLEDDGGEEATVKEARQEILKFISRLERQVSIMGSLMFQQCTRVSTRPGTRQGFKRRRKSIG